ncbi:hypothetical protein B0H11DRAFT_402504 [Mycena galericulata]|nr:hypothetical protein B0H11DRAFT_402504 [Mycena galericulata]
MDVEVNRVLRTLTQPAPSSEAIDANGPSADAMLPTPHDTGRSPQFHVTGSQQTQLTSEATKDTHSTSMERLKDTQLEAEREDRQPSPQLNTPAAVQAIFKTMVDNVNKLIASSTDMSDVSVPVEELPTPPSSERSPQAEDARSWPMETSSEHPANLPVSHTGEGIYLEDITPSPSTFGHICVRLTDLSTETGIQAATVIARHRGLTNGTITIDFSINPNQLESIMKWNNRAKHHEDIEESLCITLLCFSLADIKTRMESSESKDFRSLLPELECLWPKTGGLTMNALWNGQRINFPLAPPFALPSNGFVDVSPFLVSGKNTVCITQTRDMSKYWIILCAHHPTTSQIHTVARRRYKERNWTGWLDKISQPLQLPFRIPIEV